MRAARYRVRTALVDIPDIQVRQVDDPAGDNGSFLITTYPTPEASQEMTKELLALGIKAGPGGNLLCHFTNYGFHLYYNLPALVKKASTSPDGFPETHPLNQDSHYDYEKDALPQTDELFASSIIQAIPFNRVNFGNLIDFCLPRGLFVHLKNWRPRTAESRAKVMEQPRIFSLVNSGNECGAEYQNNIVPE